MCLARTEPRYTGFDTASTFVELFLSSLPYRSVFFARQGFTLFAHGMVCSHSGLSAPYTGPKLRVQHRKTVQNKDVQVNNQLALDKRADIVMADGNDGAESKKRTGTRGHWRR